MTTRFDFALCLNYYPNFNFLKYFRLQFSIHTPSCPESGDENSAHYDHDCGHNSAPRNPLKLPQKKVTDEKHPDRSGAAKGQSGGNGGKYEGSGQEESGHDVDASGGDEPQDVPTEGLFDFPFRKKGLASDEQHISRRKSHSQSNTRRFLVCEGKLDEYRCHGVGHRSNKGEDQSSSEPSSKRLRFILPNT